MRGMKVISAIWALILAIVIVFCNCNADLTKVYDDPGQEIHVTAGQEFTISTKPNASTGWVLQLKEFDTSFLALVEDKVMPDTFQKRNLKFKTLKKGRTEIKMEFRPYWWDTIPPDKQKEYPVNTKAFSIIIN